ncbi:MAG: DUF6504 family protein [Planctomycetota bacterium]
MERFLGEQIEVEQAERSPRPVRFTWRGETHEVAEVLRTDVDVGHGSLPPSSRKWYTRRHRRHYVVRDTDGKNFELYLDYADRRHPTWWLAKRWE